MSRLARDNPEDWDGAWELLVDRADDMRKRAREEGIPSRPTPPSQESANPSPPHAEQLPTRLSASTNSSEIDPAPSPGVQTISGACHNGGSSPSVLHKHSDNPTPTETNSNE